MKGQRASFLPIVKYMVIINFWFGDNKLQDILFLFQLSSFRVQVLTFHFCSEIFFDRIHFEEESDASISFTYTSIIKITMYSKRAFLSGLPLLKTAVSVCTFSGFSKWFDVTFAATWRHWCENYHPCLILRTRKLSISRQKQIPRWDLSPKAQVYCVTLRYSLRPSLDADLSLLLKH